MLKSWNIDYKGQILLTEDIIKKGGSAVEKRLAKMKREVDEHLEEQEITKIKELSIGIIHNTTTSAENLSVLVGTFVDALREKKKIRGRTNKYFSGSFTRFDTNLKKGQVLVTIYAN